MQVIITATKFFNRKLNHASATQPVFKSGTRYKPQTFNEIPQGNPPKFRNHKCILWFINISMKYSICTSFNNRNRRTRGLADKRTTRTTFSFALKQEALTVHRFCIIARTKNFSHVSRAEFERIQLFIQRYRNRGQFLPRPFARREHKRPSKQNGF